MRSIEPGLANHAATRRALPLLSVGAASLALAETLRAVVEFDLPLWRALVQNVAWWGTWIALTPAVGLVCRLAPWRGRGAWLGGLRLHVPAAVGLSAVHLAVASGVVFATRHWPARHATYAAMLRELAGAYAILDIVTYTTIVAAISASASALRLALNERAVAEAALRAERLEREVLEVRLRALQQQLNPHFLFNSLNAIAGLARTGRTQDVTAALADLGVLLRQTLQLEAWSKIPLAAELDLVGRFASIERLRFGDAFELSIEVAPGLEAEVPPLLLQPLVENALRHGGAPARVHIAAWSEADAVRVSVENDAAPAVTATSGFGIGLANTRARLEALYGGRARLDVRREPTRTIVEVALPQEAAHGDASAARR
jgi:hypothetical protein